MKKLCIFIFSIVCSLVLFSTLLINAKENDFNYNECNTFNYIGNKEYNNIEVIFNINLEEILDILYIRFGASGNGSDDWVTNYRQYYITVMGE